jgi:hypothetical protein
MLLPEAIRRELSTQVKKHIGPKLAVDREKSTSLNRGGKSRLFSDRETAKIIELDSKKPPPRIVPTPQTDLSELRSPSGSPQQALPAIKIRIGLTPAGSKRLLTPQSGRLG